MRDSPSMDIPARMRNTERRGRVHAATDELRRLHPQRRPRSGAGGRPRAAWRSRWPEEGQERAQTATAQAAGTGTAAGVEDTDASWARASTEDGRKGMRV